MVSNGALARPWRCSVRVAVVALLFFSGASVLIWKAIDLQVAQHSFLSSKGGALHVRQLEIPANRGMITDRNGEPLAISVPVDAIWVDPAQLQNKETELRELASILNLEADTLIQQVKEAANRRFMYVQRQVPPEIGEKVKALRVAGIHTRREYRRFYPSGEVSAPLIGFTDIDDHALEGIELAYDEWLTGEPGLRRIIKDLHGRVIENLGVVREARPGRPLALSIDRRLQYLAYRELRAGIEAHNAKGGMAVLMDARTGEVLAMANVPSFNPNNRLSIHPSRTRNRAIIDQFEPGSAIKPFLVLAALQTGRYTPQTVIDTSPGWIKVDRFTIRDHRDYGVMDVTGVLQKSSNVGATRIAMDVGRESLWQLYDALGFGKPIGTGFPGEASGKLTFWRHWSSSDIAAHAYGYGMSVTALQLASAYATLANEGRAVRPSLLRLEQAPTGEQVVPARYAREVVNMLQSVTEEGGTGTRAKVPGYLVAGKTGTARKSEGGGYSNKRYVTVFAGMAPASDPKLVLVVVVDEPQGDTIFAGQVAAPIFREIMAGALRMLNVRPDDIPGVELPSHHSVVAFNHRQEQGQGGE
ncbi:MAG TPA: penicillin-binding protein 2 [Halothiobacillus sp.]|nr:penicillin-binding protein 2 [Halothiobacillus sp.]